MSVLRRAMLPFLSIRFLGLRLISVLLVFSTSPLAAQQGEQLPFQSAVPPARSLPVPPSSAAVPSDGALLRRIRVANGNARLSQMDFIGEGVVTIQTENGPSTFSVLVLRNGNRGQSVSLKRADASKWDSDPSHLDSSGRRILDFLQTQHTRGLPELLTTGERNARVLDSGTMETAHTLVVVESDSVATRYVFDNAAWRLTRIDLQRGRSAAASGQLLPNIESYLFSDFRMIQGLPTPFMVEHYTNDVKQEELRFTTVRYSPIDRTVPASRGGQGR